MSDPEVSGPGVIVGFILTGALTLGASITTLWLRRLKDPEYKRFFEARRTSHNLRERITALIRLCLINLTSKFLKLLSRLVPTGPQEPISLWTDVLEDFVLELSDQQLITGLLVLISGFAIYLRGDIDGNLYIAGDLAFFSGITHASTLMTLRPYLRRHKKMTTLRIIVVLSTLTLWLMQATLYLAENSLWELYSYYDSLSAGFQYGSEIAEIIGIVWIYIDVCVPLVITDKAIKARAALSRPLQVGFPEAEAWIENCQADRRGSTRLFTGLLTRLFVWFYQHYIHMKPSLLRGVLWIILEALFPWYMTSFALFGLFVVGLANLALDVQESGIDNVWGFGQLLPTFLILLPIFTIIESYTVRHKPIDRNEAGNLSSQDDNDEIAIELSDNAVQVRDRGHRQGDQSPIPGIAHDSHGSVHTHADGVACVYSLLLSACQVPLPSSPVSETNSDDVVS